jgi:GntR family transcriptional regulator
VELANRLGVSRSTVRQAMQRLVHEQLLVRKRNAGTRVAGPQLKTCLSDWMSFTGEMLRRGVKPQTLAIKVRLASPPAEVARFFGAERSRSCIRLIRLRGQAEEPIVEFRSWLHPRLGLRVDDDFTKPLYELIESRSGIVAALSSEEISAIAADRELATELRCDLAEPLLVRRRRVSDVGGKPIEFCDCFYRADRFTYCIDIRRGSEEGAV